jgi:hypothetical protein
VPKLADNRFRADRSVNIRTVNGHLVEIDRDFTYVRITPRQGARREGLFRPPLVAHMDLDVLAVEDRQNGTSAEYRIEDIAQVEVAQHDGARSEPLLIGILVGAAAGALVGYAIGADCPEHLQGEGSICLPRGVSAFAVGFLGAGAGALVSLPFVAQVKYY